MLMAAIGAYQLAAKSGLLAGLTGGNKKDQERIDTARAKATAAIGGDVEAAKYVWGAQFGSATQVGKDAYKSAWQSIVAQRPDIAAAAAPAGTISAVVANGPAVAQSSALQAEVNALRDKIRTDLANSVQRIGAGATNQLAQHIAPDGAPVNDSVTIPTNKRQLLTIAAVVVAVVVVVWFLGRAGK